MNLSLALILLAAPLTQASRSPVLEEGVYPAGIVLAAIGRLTERPVYVETPAIGNVPIRLERRLIVARGHLAAMQSVLHDVGIALVELDPDAEVPIAWVASRNVAAVDRPIRLQVRVLHLEYAPVDEVADRLNAVAEESESLLPPGDVPTRFIPDPRTGSIIARYTSETRLETYLALLAELDRPAESGEKTLVMRTYRPRRIHASALLPLVEAEWDERGGHAIRVVVPADQNVLLVRCPRATWEVLEPLIRSLDR